MFTGIHRYQTASYNDSSAASSGADSGTCVSSVIIGNAFELAFGVAPGCMSGTCTRCSGTSVRSTVSVTSLLLDAGA